MQTVGWVVQTKGSVGTRYWHVGVVDGDDAVRKAVNLGHATTGKTLSKIAGHSPVGLSLDPDSIVEVWQRRPAPELPSGSARQSHDSQSEPNKVGEITFDTVVSEDGCQYAVDGCYRLAGQDWSVYFLRRRDIFSPERDQKVIRNKVVFQSGIIGVDGWVAHDAKLSKEEVMKIMSEVLGVIQWDEVSGPNSLLLK